MLYVLSLSQNDFVTEEGKLFKIEFLMVPASSTGALTKRNARLPLVNEIPKKSFPGGWFREGMAEKTSC